MNIQSMIPGGDLATLMKDLRELLDSRKLDEPEGEGEDEAAVEPAEESEPQPG